MNMEINEISAKPDSDSEGMAAISTTLTGTRDELTSTCTIQDDACILVPRKLLLISKSRSGDNTVELFPVAELKKQGWEIIGGLCNNL